MKKAVPKPCCFLFFYFQNKTVLYIILFFLNLTWKQNYLRPGLTVYKQISFFDFFPDKYIRCYVLNLLKPRSFAHSKIFNRTHGTSKPANYIYENDH